MNRQKILIKAHKYVETYLTHKRKPGYVYHDLRGRKNYVKDCLKLAHAAQLEGEAIFLLELAALFKDIGRGIEGKSLEEVSCSVTQKFSASIELNPQLVASLVSLLKEEKQEEEKLKIMSHILRDAEWAFWGKKSFNRKATLLYLEKKNLSEEPIQERIWYKELLDKMTRHRFLTPWANEKYAKRKNKNLLKLKSKIKKLKKQHKRFRSGKDFGRGIDTAYRIALKNHTDLSRIADGKANMIISINTLLLSILITALTAALSIESLSENLSLKNYLPILVLLLSSLTATAFAVYSAVPKINSLETFNPEDLEKKNMLFFGNFLAMGKQDFVTHLRKLRTDQGKLYDNLSRDLYGLGAVLERKYYLLGISYRVFMAGLLLSFFSFLILILFT